MVLTQLLCAALLSTAPVATPLAKGTPVAKPAQATQPSEDSTQVATAAPEAPPPAPTPVEPPEPSTALRDRAYQPGFLPPLAEGVAGIIGGFLGSLIATFPALLIPEGHGRDVYSLVAWTVAAPLASSGTVYWSGGLNQRRERSFGWALTGALAGEAVAAGFFFGLGGFDRVRGEDGVGISFWPLVLAPIVCAIGSTVMMELMSKDKPVNVTLAPMFLPLRDGWAKGFQLAAQF